MSLSPRESGLYWVFLSDGTVQQMRYGTSCKWDNRRERHEGPDKRVLFWSDDKGRPEDPPLRTALAQMVRLMKART